MHFLNLLNAFDVMVDYFEMLIALYYVHCGLDIQFSKVTHTPATAVTLAG